MSQPVGTSGFDRTLIIQSFELAAERGKDITPLVYEKLFARCPDMEPLFVRDKTGAVRGEMLARVIELILDFITDRSYADHLIQCEVITHEGYGVPREIFGTFFETVAETLREVLGPDWSPAVEESWQTLLIALSYFVAHTDQAATADA